MELIGQHRQANGDPLLAILSLLRVGICDDADLAVLNCTWTDEAEEWTGFQHLRARTCDAQAYNERRLAELEEAIGTFNCRDEVQASVDGAALPAGGGPYCPKWLPM